MPTHRERQKLLDAEREYFYSKSKSLLKDDCVSADYGKLKSKIEYDYKQQVFDTSLDLDQLSSPLNRLDTMLAKETRPRVKVCETNCRTTSPTEPYWQKNEREIRL